MGDRTKEAEIKPKDCKFDIIMPSHGNLEMTLRSVKAVYSHTVTPFHLIVLDDTQDMTDAYLWEFCQKKPNMTYHHRETPFKNGNQIFNIGFEIAMTPIAATVMNSIVVEPDWEDVGLKLMEKDPQIGVIGFKCLFPNGMIESAGIAMVKWLPTDIGRDQPGHRLAKIYPCDAVQWAFAMVRVKAAKGFIDEACFHGFRGWDDIDNCFVLKKHGWKSVYCGLGVGYHQPRATRGDDSQVAFDENAENGEMFHKRWGYWEQFKKDNPGALERLQTLSEAKVAA